MTYRQRHRQNLLRTIELWMRRYGAYFVFALCFSLATANAATDETTKSPVKPTSLMKILSDKDILTATAPATAKTDVKKETVAPKAVAPAAKAVAPAVKSAEKKVSADTKKKDKDADAKKKDEKTREGLVAGTVMFIRKNSLSVEVASGQPGAGNDMYLPLDKEVKLQRVKEFSQIKRGDQVQVKYQQTYIEPKEKGSPEMISGTLGTEITLLKAAVTAKPKGVLSD